MSMKSYLLNLLKRLLGIPLILNEIKKQNEDAALRTGLILEDIYLKKEKIQSLADVEFRVFSQWGDDGIISWLTRQLNIENPFFVEFGVQTYEESNTRFLLQRQNWQGLVIDGYRPYIDFILADPICWRHHLTPHHLFITKDNIDAFLKKNCPKPDIDLLSIDIDGNDYWILQAIQSVRPKILICEYNSLFGNELAVTVPYKVDFDRTSAHFSCLYFGASIQALIQLAEDKGYVFVGTNWNGNNAYFIRQDLSEPIQRKIENKKIYTAQFRESRDPDGKLNFLSGLQGLRSIADMQLYSLSAQKLVEVRELYSLDKDR